jgi:hypothetical protein
VGAGELLARECLAALLLQPAHESIDTLMGLTRDMGPIAFWAQYQQAPIPPGGTIIKRKWLKTYDELRFRQDDRIVMSWDIALSEMETGDYAACVVLVANRGHVTILRNRREFICEDCRGAARFSRLAGFALGKLNRVSMARRGCRFRLPLRRRTIKSSANRH